MKNLTFPSLKSLAISAYIIGSIILIFTTVLIIYHLLTTKFPTHSDVFWIGVQVGVLGTISLIFLIIGLFPLYNIVKRFL